MMLAASAIVFSVWWAKVDAKSRGGRVRGYEIVFLLILTPIGLAAYLLRTRVFSLAIFLMLLAAFGYYGIIFLGVWVGENVVL